MTDHHSAGMQPSSGAGRDARRRHPGLAVALGLLLLLAPSVSYPARPEADPPSQGPERVHRLTLDEIIDMGLEASPKLWANRYVIDQAAAQLGQAKAGRLPRMEYHQIASVVPEARGNAIFSPNERSNLLENLAPFTRLELNIQQPLYTFGRLRAHIEAAEKGLVARKAALRRFEAELIMTLKELYYASLLNEDLHRLLSKTEEEFGKAVEKAEELIEEDAGTLTQQDLLKLRYGHTRAGGQLLEIEKGQRLTHAALLRLLFLPEGEDYELTEDRLRPVQLTLEDLETYKLRARHNRAEWQQLEAGIEAKEAELVAEQRTYFPDIFAYGTMQYAVAPNRDKQENPFVVEEFNYFWGGVFFGWRWNLDFGIPKRIAEKRAELRSLQQEQREATSGMLLEVEKAYRELEEKQKGLGFARKARRNGRALSALSAASFQLGLGEAKEVFEAFHIYTESAAQYYLAIRDFNMAVAELARVTGMRSIE